MTFKKFRKKISARSKSPLVSIRRDGYIVLNGNAVESYLGPSKHVHLLFDREMKRVAIKPLQAGEADAYAARCREIRGGKGVMVHAATFLRHYGNRWGHVPRVHVPDLGTDGDTYQGYMSPI